MCRSKYRNLKLKISMWLNTSNSLKKYFYFNCHYVERLSWKERLTRNLRVPSSNHQNPKSCSFVSAGLSLNLLWASVHEKEWQDHTGNKSVTFVCYPGTTTSPKKINQLSYISKYIRRIKVNTVDLYPREHQHIFCVHSL